MKKTKIITATIGLCVAASLFAGCSNGSTGETAQASRLEGGQTQISVEVTQATSAVTGDVYKFTYKGYDIIPGKDATALLASLGDAEDIFSAASCAGQGLATAYTYPEFVLYTYEENGQELIDGIEIENPLTDCDGVHVGDKIEVAKATFGTPVQEDDYGILYTAGNTGIQINTDGAGTIVAITYRRVLD